MIQENPPKDGRMNLFPSTLIGYNMQAFENLVIDEETKHLVKALVSNQIKAEKSTDLISGKGNGLIILLHGGPRTGKTFTAGNVAELVEKPLYRVTCGDIGTRPEDVEKYIESVLLLGKIWGRVVLLDEADVFLEERTLTDLQRNALVSVLLRVLEYYDGILILTSNRVGTFGQAFKSRIQLALHYENLTTPQRRETEVDYEELGDHIDELVKEEMNGGQIRKAITTARQMVQFDSEKFSYKQLKHVIKVASKFENYLKEVKQGFSDDQMAREDGTR
ncbi:P-loop containing nucleoside triphosphate hydrolase protein [Camillea tinctor]|nr:P-loop containing nucleoside triphosphate hydrolase protein [Camillea tinctor]